MEDNATRLGLSSCGGGTAIYQDREQAPHETQVFKDSEGYSTV